VALYAATYSSVPTSDGYEWVALVDRGAAREMLPAYHALPMYAVFLLGRLLAAAGLPVATLPLIQGVNALLAGAGAVLLYRAVVVLGGGDALGLVGGGLLAVSFGFWYFANGELHHFSLVLLEVIFFLILRARARGEVLRWPALAGLGALNALAVLFHQENFLFGAAAVAMLMVGRSSREGVRDSLVYALTGSVATAGLAVLIGIGPRGSQGLDELLRWFFWVFYAAGEPQPYRLGNALSAVLRMAKGQLTALTFGTQVAADASRDPALLGIPAVSALTALTLMSFAIVVALVAALWLRRRALPMPLRAAAVGCLVWLGAYKVVLHWWFWPTAPEYHIVTLPPLILLLLLGSIARRAERSTARPRVPWALGAPLALLVLVALTDFAGAIRPWHQYGTMKDALAARARTTFRPDDLLVSSESGIDAVLARTGEHLRLKDVFVHSSGDAGFARIRAAIAGQLAAGRRVFVYNLVPSPFTLLGVAHAAGARGVPPPTAEDFARFAEELASAYALVPVLSYWEESREPLYLFGRRSAQIWQVTPRTP